MMSLSCKNHIGRTALGVRKPAPPAAHIVAGCGDRSGSMQSMRGAPPLQFHEQMLMLADTGKKLDVPTIFTLVTFDDRTEVPFEQINLTETPTADLPSQSEFVDHMQPRGMTSLYQSGLMTLRMLESHVEDYRRSLPSVVQKLDPNIMTSYVLLTDGEDNTSERGCKEAHVAKLKELRASGTMAIFLGANIDAGATGMSMGFERQTSIQVTPTFNGAECALRSVSNTLQRASTGDDSQQVNILPESDESEPPPLPWGWTPPPITRSNCLRN